MNAKQATARLYAEKLLDLPLESFTMEEERVVLKVASYLQNCADLGRLV